MPPKILNQENIVFVICFAFVALFDNYVTPPGIRIFDVIGGVGVIILVLFHGLRLHRYYRPSIIFWIFLAVTLLYTIPRGMFVLESNSWMPFSFGILIYLIIINSKTFNDSALSIVRRTLLIISFGLVLQYALYLATNELPSFIILGTDTLTRSNFAGFVERPTGFYIEPGSHCIATISLIAIYLTLNNYRFDRIALLATISIILSMSLAGIIGLIFLLLILATKKSFTRATIYIAGASVVLFFVYYYAHDTLRHTIDLVLVNRFEVIDAGIDGSANDRILKLSIECFRKISVESPVFGLIGNSLSSDAFTSYCGSNNIAWAIYNYGFVFPILFLATLIYRFRSAPLILLSIAYIAFSGQISSYLFIWIYLALINGPILSLVSKRGLSNSTQ